MMVQSLPEILHASVNDQYIHISTNYFVKSRPYLTAKDITTLCDYINASRRSWQPGTITPPRPKVTMVVSIEVFPT